VIYDNFCRNALINTNLGKHPNIKLIKGDVLDIKRLKKSMDGVDVVVGAVVIVRNNDVIKIHTHTIRLNIIGTANVLEVAKENKMKDRLIDFYTSKVFGN